jgi:uncharacterized protein YaiI (UPF0178 family)
MTWAPNNFHNIYEDAISCPVYKYVSYVALQLACFFVGNQAVRCMGNMQVSQVAAHQRN